MVLANYPVRDGRVANGVGLDTPTSLTNMLSWLDQEGYNLGSVPFPQSSDALIRQLLKGRTNAPEGLN